MLSRLKEHGFRTIVLARHPLDVLISILVFSQHYHATAEWLDGSYGDERCLQGSCPMSEAFAAYAAGRGLARCWESAPVSWLRRTRFPCGTKTWCATRPANRRELFRN